MKIEEFRKKHGKNERRRLARFEGQCPFVPALNGMEEKMEKEMKKSGKTGYMLRLFY